MPNAQDIRWFKEQFHQDIEPALAGTPFDLDMIVAIACQETGEVWPILRRTSMSRADILALCVGDTLDSDRGRSAFPKTKADLVAKPNGQAMFDVARKALVDMAVHIKSYQGAASRPNKFCHGFGLFQRDLQFFLVDPDYFLQRRYEKLDETLKHCLGELTKAVKKLGHQGKPSLSDFEFATVAIAYNTGGFKPERGLKQGFEVDGRFYGEMIFDFVRLSRTVPKPGGAPAIAPPPAGEAIVPPPSPVEATGTAFVVDTQDSPLRLRSEPAISDPPGKNVLAHLPDGHPVRAITGRKVNGFIEVETSLNGAHLRGFASAKFLVSETTPAPIPIVTPAAAPPVSGIVAVNMFPKTGTAKRTAFATAHSLNEPRQPGRKGTTPEELVAEILAIIDWLAVDDAAHTRYQPRDGLTFCNIYVHDFCHLAGAYVPRVWWTQRAVIDLTQGKAVEPLIGSTITEMRANGLFGWLNDFGPSFGWRRTGTLSDLQQAANQGGLGLIVAKRKDEGRSGHIVMVVPEAEGRAARRNAAGEVIAPLQSQAGETNFQFGTSTLNWWRHERFADSAFWIHA